MMVATPTHYIQLMSSYAPAWGFGGPIRLMYEYARWLAAAGHTVTVFTGDVHHDYSRIIPTCEQLDGIRIKRVPILLRGLVRRNINLVSPSILFRSARLIRQSDGPVIVHICELRGLVPLYGTMLKRLFPRKVLLLHSAFGMLHDKPGPLRAAYDRLILGPQIRALDIGLAQNNHELECYRNTLTRANARHGTPVLFPLHVAQRGHGPADDGDANRRRLRRQYGVHEDALVLIFLGRLHPDKGICRTIDAFQHFSSQWPKPVRLLIVGRDDGGQEEIAARIRFHEAEDRIRIINNVYQERFDYYTLADIFVGFPTIYEETMLASVEALSCGTPLLVSREADIPYVETEGAGFVVDFAPDAVAACLHAIASDLDGYRRRAASTAARHFSESGARQAFLDLLTVQQPQPATP